MTRREELEALLAVGLAAADPEAATQRWLADAASPLEEPLDERLGDRRLTVVAAGKAAGPMARAVAREWGDRIDRGLVVTRDGHDPGPDSFSRCYAGHPLPDERSAAAGDEVLRLAAGVPFEAALIVLLSGGASALLTTPAAGLALAEIRAVSDALMRAGAGIEELNAVRRCLTRVSGGRLALSCQAEVIEVAAISDVPGDVLATLGSGPCAPATTSAADAVEVLVRRLGDGTPPAVLAHLRSGLAEPPDAASDRFARVRHEIIANNEDALAAIEAVAAARGIATWRAAAPLSGEARECAQALVDQARQRGGPGLLLAGGETTVTVRGEGRGGRNQELALAAACALAGDPELSILAAGSDGTDGPTDAAGAFADGGSLERGRMAGVDARGCLAENDAHRFFAAEGGLLRTGPTGTNVMDLVLIGRGALGFTADPDR